MFDTVLERPKDILLVFESHKNIPVMLGNTWVNICWPHCWLESVQIRRLLMYLRTWSSSGWVLMKNILLGSESMDHQLFNAPSTMFLWHLGMFLHFETYALENPQKAYFSGGSEPQFDFLPQIYLFLSVWLHNCIPNRWHFKSVFCVHLLRNVLLET